jgi:hypothetical protein
MIDLKNARLPVQLKPEDAEKLFETLHDMKTAAASEGSDALFSLARAALQLLSASLGLNPAEARETQTDCPWCGRVKD